MNIAPEIIAAWVAIGGYAVASAALIIGTFFGKRTVEAFGVRAAWVGLAAHAVAILVRWVRIGHGPYLGFYEVSSLFAFMAVAGFVVMVRRYSGLRVAGVATMPLAFLIMGASLLVNKEAQAMTSALSSAWLAIHVVFSNLAFGSYVVSFVLGVAFLMKEGGTGRRWQALLDRFPAQDVLDGLTFRFVGAGFVFQGIMIASGAIWANEAWGRYWGWDPMETWSLIAWAVYAIYMHLTLTLGWRGKRAAWVAIIALPVILFSLLGVPVVYNSIHGAYLTR